MSAKKVLSTAFFIALLSGGSSFSLANAQDWTRFRGPNGEGKSSAENIPVEFGEGDMHWKIELPGEGHSSPVVWGDNVFLMSAIPETAERVVMCVDAKSGESKWEHHFPSKTYRLHRRSSYASSSPAVDEKHVYFVWAEPDSTTLMAFDHDGNEVWTRDLGTFISQHGFGASPIVYGDMVLIMHSQQADQVPQGQQPGKSMMMALDRMTGSQLWQTPLKTTRVCYSVPCIMKDKSGEESIIGYNTGNGIFALDPSDGSIKWEISLFEMRTVASTLVVDDMIIGSNGSGGGGNYLVTIKSGEVPRELYRVKASANYVPTPIAHEGMLFVFNDKGIVSCIELESGEVKWRERMSDAFSGSPVLVQDRLYCIAENGDLFVVKASPEFELLATNPLGELSYSTPAISDGHMYLRTSSHLMSVGGTE